jgi:phosphate starvation-inducible PhoH-like protein
LATFNDSSPSGEAIAHAELQVDGVAMVRLLGPQDRLLTTIEHQFPQVTVLVRGNLVTPRGRATRSRRPSGS